MRRILIILKHIFANWTVDQVASCLLFIAGVIVWLIAALAPRTPHVNFLHNYLDDALLLILLGMVLTALLRRKLPLNAPTKQIAPALNNRSDAIFELADEAILLVDAEGIIRDCNRMATTMYLFTREEMIGQPFARLQLSNAPNAVNNTEHQRKDGQLFSVEVHTASLLDGSNSEKVYYIRDISRLKHLEESLSEERFYFNTLMNNVHDMIYFKDNDSRFVRVNNAYAQRFNFKEPAELIGKSDFDIFADQHSADAFADEQRIMATGEALLGKVEKETISATKIAWVLTSKLPMRDTQGNVIGTFGISRDITEYKLAEDAVKRHERFMTNIFSSIQDGISVLDADLKVVQVNHALERLFPQESSFNGRTCYDVYHQSQAPCDDCPSLRTIASGKVESTTMCFCKKSPEETDNWFEVFSFPLIDPKSGKVTGVIESFRDITERKTAEDALKQLTAELERSNSELQQFAYIASHDLQEPLRMVTSYVQLLARRYRGKLDSDAEEFIQFAVDGASRMKNLINDLLTYSRVGTHGKEFALANCNEVLGKSLSNLQLAIEDQHAEIRVNELPTLMVDASQLTQLFQNLVGNALKFQRPGMIPVVEISAWEETEQWLFAVKDNGIGIEPQYSEKIFAIFQRLHNKEDYPGTGIGLAVCRKIVERHGGTIWMESELGDGATFFFTISTAGKAK